MESPVAKVWVSRDRLWACNCLHWDRQWWKRWLSMDRTCLTEEEAWSLSACSSSLERFSADESNCKARTYRTNCSTRRCASVCGPKDGLSCPSRTPKKQIGLFIQIKDNFRMRVSLPSGEEDGDDAVLEPERWLWVDSLRAAARGEARLRATSTMHSTSASTKFNLANVSLCSFCGNDAIEFVLKTCVKCTWHSPHSN